MQNRQLYTQMPDSAKESYRQELTSYVSTRLPLLTQPATTPEAVQTRKSALMEGFSLATAFSFCRDFVSERTMFNDFSPSVSKRLSQYFQEIIKQTAINNVVSSMSAASAPTASSVGPIASAPDASPSTSTKVNGSTSAVPDFSVIANPNSRPKQSDLGHLPQRHRGRPTKQEAQAYTQAVAAKTAHDNAVHPSAFPQPVLGDASPNDPQTANFNFTMREYKWLLSDALQHDVEGLRDYRTAFSDASQKAKFLAEQYSVNGSMSADQKAEIAQYAQEAKEMNKLIESIYSAVDNELAECCLRLKYDPHYIKQMQSRKVNVEELRQALVPKYKEAVAKNPAFKQSVFDKISDEDPQLAQQRQQLATAKSRVDAIRKYLLRTDKPATKKRISTMELRIAELRDLDKQFPSLKIEPDSYLPVLEKTKSALNSKS